MDTKNPYVFVTDSSRNTFNDMKINQNDENLQEVPADILASRDFVSANLSAIAQVCNCTAEHVNQFLSRMRDLIINTIIAKRKQVMITLPIG